MRETLEILVKKILALSVLAACTVASGLAQAQSAEIKVVGKILPDACQPVIANGGVFSYGTIAADKLSKDDVTALVAKTQTLTITCNAAAKIGVKVTDNRSGTAVGGTGDGYDFGLGGKNTGSYSLKLTGAVSEGNTLAVLTDTSGSGTWVSNDTGFKADGTARKAFAPSGSLVPGAYKVVTGDLTVRPVINKLSALDIGSGIDLDGSATLELVYL